MKWSRRHAFTPFLNPGVRAIAASPARRLPRGTSTFIAGGGCRVGSVRACVLTLHDFRMLATIDRLLCEAAPPPSPRIVERQAIHQLFSLLPHLTEAQQVGGLRRVKQLLRRALFNLHVCTAGLQLVSVVLRWLAPEAPALSQPVMDEVLGLLSELGGYRATALELRTLFDLLQGTLKAPAINLGGSSSAAAAPRSCRVTADQLLTLFVRWCEPSATDLSKRDTGPQAPLASFDFDGRAGGLSLPSELAVEVVSRGAFTVGGWLRLEDEVAGGTTAEGLLLLSMLGKGGEVGIEVFLQPGQGQLAVCVHGGSSSAASKLLRRGRPLAPAPHLAAPCASVARSS